MDVPDQDCNVGVDRDSMITKIFGLVKTVQLANGLQIMAALVKQSHHVLEQDNIQLLILTVVNLVQHAKLDGK